MTKRSKINKYNILCCPECRGELVFSETNQTFRCQDHGEFNRINGIFSFTQIDEFDNHWEKHSNEETPENKKIVARNFLKPLFNFLNNQEQPCTVLDAGCGDGIHNLVIEEKYNDYKNINFSAVDISLIAIKIAESRVENNSIFSFYHANISKLPFADETIDATFSYGVLAYTELPFHSFSELYRVTKKGGLIGVWIYPRATGIKGFIFNLTRKLCPILGKIGTRIISDLIVPFLGFLPTSSKMNLFNSSWKQCREIVMVNIAPRQLFFPGLLEIEDWFRKYNLKIIKMDKENPITIWGLKR